MRAPLLYIVLPLALAACSGCGVESPTESRLELRGSPEGPANLIFDRMLWRQQPDGIEVIGYTLAPTFPTQENSDYYGAYYTPTDWLACGLHLVPQPGGRCLITILGPPQQEPTAPLVGYADGVKVMPDGDLRRIDLANAPIFFRLHSNQPLHLSGTIIASPNQKGAFERELNEFLADERTRDLPATIPPAKAK